jgi:hypothetical protein
VDKTALFYNVQPNRILAVKMETCHRRKKGRDRLTNLLYYDAEGREKVYLLVAGKCLKTHAA